MNYIYRQNLNNKNNQYKYKYSFYNTNTYYFFSILYKKTKDNNNYYLQEGIIMIHLYFHGGSSNHGCEAIVRSTSAMFLNKMVLHTRNIKSDLRYNLNKIVTLEEDVAKQINKKSFNYLIFALCHKFNKSDYLYTYFSHKKFFSGVKKNDIYMSIGGDNYCYNGTDILGHYNLCLQKNGAKTVLWGCSVEPDIIKNPDVAKDLAMYDLITARESISYEALKSINPNTVLVSDPAFTLERKDLPLPKGWIEGKMIGINSSPLILKDCKDGIILKAYKKLIQTILDTTDCSVVLIPHVSLPSSDDRLVLNLLRKDFEKTERVIQLDDCNCMQLKGYIARCRMFIGARTHATIAAYSTCVPTLVLGYSVKSKGIARDIFGSEENYVLPIQNITTENTLSDSFNWLLKNENNIRNHLKQIMPKYIEKAYIGLIQIEKLSQR